MTDTPPGPVDPDAEITLTLHPAEVQHILIAVGGSGTFNEVAGLVTKIQRQANEQLSTRPVHRHGPDCEHGEGATGNVDPVT